MMAGVRCWVRSAVGWLRAGYPNNIPRTGYSPLLGLCGPVALTPRQTGAVLEHLHGRRADIADVGVAITKVTDRLPNRDQVHTVERALHRTSRTAGD